MNIYLSTRFSYKVLLVSILKRANLAISVGQIRPISPLMHSKAEDQNVGKSPCFGHKPPSLTSVHLVTHGQDDVGTQ